MSNLYMIGLIALAGLMFIVGLAMLIRGYRRYDFHPLTLLVPFVVAAVFSFPAYFALKERFLKKSGAADDEIRQTHRQTMLGVAFVIAFFAVTFITVVCFFVQSFDAIVTAEAETLDLDGAVLGLWLFWGLLAVCVLYAAAALGASCRKKSA